MKLFLQIAKFDGSGNPALICAICLKELSKAMHFRNKAIRAEKYFKRSDVKGEDGTDVAGVEFEPEVHIKLEDDEFNKIKSEPFDEDPNYEFMHNIDLMTGSSCNADGSVQSTSFVDVKLTRDFFHEERTVVVKSRHFNRYDEEFGSSSGVVRCKLCMKSFTSVNSHHNHMKTVHREMSESEMHRCKYCNRYFKLKIYLNRHIQRIHGSKHKFAKGRCDSKKKSYETIFNKEDVSLYCEVSINEDQPYSEMNRILIIVVQAILYDSRKSSEACSSKT